MPLFVALSLALCPSLLHSRSRKFREDYARARKCLVQHGSADRRNGVRADVFAGRTVLVPVLTPTAVNMLIVNPADGLKQVGTA